MASTYSNIMFTKSFRVKNIEFIFTPLFGLWLVLLVLVFVFPTMLMLAFVIYSLLASVFVLSKWGFRLAKGQRTFNEVFG